MRNKIMDAPKWARLILGVLLIIGGIFGALPVLGFWMLPLGVLVLSYDLGWVRRRRRRFDVWFHRKWRSLRNRRGREA